MNNIEPTSMVLFPNFDKTIPETVYPHSLVKEQEEMKKKGRVDDVRTFLATLVVEQQTNQFSTVDVFDHVGEVFSAAGILFCSGNGECIPGCRNNYTFGYWDKDEDDKEKYMLLSPCGRRQVNGVPISWCTPGTHKKQNL